MREFLSGAHNEPFWSVRPFDAPKLMRDAPITVKVQVSTHGNLASELNFMRFYMPRLARRFVFLL